MMAAGNYQSSNTTQPYQQGEQEKKPQPLAQPQGANATQPNAQPQTFASLQRQGYARPAAPQYRAQYPQYAQPSQAPQQGTQAPAQGQYAQAQLMQDPQTSQAQQGWQALPQQQMAYTMGSPAPESVEPGGGFPGVVNYNGFNGQAPNYNPLDYMVGQMMGGQPQTNFGDAARQTQFQNYTPTGNAQLSDPAQFGYGGPNGLSQIAVQGGGGGVSANYSGANLQANPTGQFTNQGGPVADATQQKILDLLQKPSGWDSDLVQNMYNQQGAKIDDQYQAQDTAINEEMAKRGLYDSSIAGGRLKDSNLMKRDAKTNLADSLLQQMGMNYGSDQARAATLGAGYQGQQFGENTTAFGLNQGAQQQNFNQQLAGEQAKQGAFGLNQAGQIANSNAGIAAMNANLQAQQSNNQNALGAAQLNSQNLLTRNSQNLQQQAQNIGQNQFGVNTANQNLQQYFQNYLNGGQQDFNNAITHQNQQRDMNGQIINYGQQQFNNGMTQQQFNRQLSQDQWNQLMQSMGLQ